MPPMPTPIAEFRTWLTNSPADRKMALARRSETARKAIEAKLEEYSGLTEAERERRLGALELRWYLRPLMQTAPGTPQRAEALQRVPVYWHPIVKERISEWDKMGAALQKEVLDHELTMQFLSSAPQAQQAVLQAMNPAERDSFEKRAKQWKILSATERASIDNRLGRFFSMDAERQERALNGNNFPAEERQEMEKTLKAFRELPIDQRQECIESFGKFASMSREERIAFLKNVERWQAMTPEDRDKWRKVVKKVPDRPPLPQGFIPNPPPMPGQ